MAPENCPVLLESVLASCDFHRLQSRLRCLLDLARNANDDWEESLALIDLVDGERLSPWRKLVALLPHQGNDFEEESASASSNSSFDTR